MAAPRIVPIQPEGCTILATRSSRKIGPSILCCPYSDHGTLMSVTEEEIKCQSCDRRFALVDGRPILLDEDKSIHSVAAVVASADQRRLPDQGWRNRMRKSLKASYARARGQELLEKHRHLLPDDPVILVVARGFSRDFYRKLFPTARLILTDVTLQGDSHLVCDGERLPVRDGILDGVIVDRELGQMANPQGVVTELYRCLKPNGLIYSGIPLKSPLHGNPFDRQGNTVLGHKLLFRRFGQLDSLARRPLKTCSLTLINSLALVSDGVRWRRISSAGVRLIFKPILWLDRRMTLPLPAVAIFIGIKQLEGAGSAQVVGAWSGASQSVNSALAAQAEPV